MTGRLSSAEASLYRREDWRERNRMRAGDNGKGKERRKASLPLFPLPIVPYALSIFRLLLFLSGYPAGSFAEESVTGLSVLYSPCMGEES